jgi:hypothetical protein
LAMTVSQTTDGLSILIREFATVPWIGAIGGMNGAVTDPLEYNRHKIQRAIGS